MEFNQEFSKYENLVDKLKLMFNVAKVSLKDLDELPVNEIKAKIKNN